MKHTKNIFILMIVLLVVLNTTTFANAILNVTDDFNRPDNSTIDSVFSETEINGALQISNNQVRADANYVIGGGGYTVLYHDFTNATPNYIAFSINDTNWQTGDVNNIYVTNKPFQTGEIIIIVTIDDQYISLQIGNGTGGGTTTPIANYTPQTKAFIELKNIDFTTHTFDAYVDNNLAYANATFVNNLNQAKEFQWFYDENNDVNNVAYFDDYTITEQSPAPTLPTITSFTTTNNSIQNGTSTQLSWTTTDATDLDLSGTNVTGLTSYNVTPSINTTFTLTATNQNGSVNSNVKISVFYPAPIVNPPLQTFPNSNDSAPKDSIIDVFVKIMAGLGAVAVLIGIMMVAGLTGLVINQIRRR